MLTSAFYVVSFFATRGLLGWSSTDPLPPKFKLLGARIVEPHSLEGDPGAIHLWVEALDDDNFPSGVPRAYRLPYDARLAEKTEAAIRASADGKPQGGRTADFGNGQGGNGGGDRARGHALDDHNDGRRRSLFRRSARPSVCARREPDDQFFAARPAAHAPQGREIAAPFASPGSQRARRRSRSLLVGAVEMDRLGEIRNARPVDTC